MSETEKLWTLPYVMMIFLSTLTSISFNMITPVLAKYATQIGASLALAGTIAGLFSITALIVRPVSGMLADRLNRKRLLCVSTAFLCLSAMGYSCAASLPVLVAARVVHGAAFAVSGTVNVAMIASVIPRSRLGEGIGYQGLGQIVSTAVGPGLGLAIGRQFGYRMTFMASAVFLAVAVIGMLFLPNVPSPAQGLKRRFSAGDLVSWKLMPLALISGSFSLLNGVIGSFLVLLGDARAISGIGLYFTVNALCLIVIRPFAGRIADRRNLGVLVYPCLAIAAVAAALLGSAGTLSMVLVASVLKALGQGAGQPAIQAACVKMLPPEKSGLAASTYYVGADIGQGLGPILGGAISDAYGYSVMFRSCAGILLAAMLAFFLQSRAGGSGKRVEVAEVTE